MVNKLIHQYQKKFIQIQINLKANTGLSNKKWDKAIKGLTKNKLDKVENTEDGLVVTIES